MATIRPIHRLSVRLAATTAVCAAISIMPSMPMFTTPARSLITPHSAASAMGVARTSELLNMPTRLNDFPRAAHIRKAMTKNAGDQPDHQACTLEAARDLAPRPGRSATADRR